MSEDKRKAPRLPVRVEALLRQGSQAKPVITDNVSATGAFVELESPPAVNERVGVQIELGEGSELVEEARVVRHGNGGVGIEFVGGPHEALAAFLQRLTPQAVTPATKEAERRRYPRFAFGSTIKIDRGGQQQAATSIDASLGGISFCGERLALRIGDQLKLGLPRSGSPLWLGATVRRTLPSPHLGTFAFGVEFQPMSAEVLDELATLYRAWLGI